MACKLCEISTFINDNGVDLFLCVTETWLSAHGDEAKTWISTKWIWRDIILTSIAISWQWNCCSMQIYFRL